MNIYQKLIAIMNDVHGVDKKEAFKFKAFLHNDVTEATRPVFLKHGVVPLFSVDSYQNEGNRVTVKGTVSFINAEDPEDRFEVGCGAHGTDTSDKGFNKAVSMANKYAILKVLQLLDGEKDPEREAVTYKEIDDEYGFSGFVQYDPLRGLSLSQVNLNQLKAFSEFLQAEGISLSNDERNQLKKRQTELKKDKK